MESNAALRHLESDYKRNATTLPLPLSIFRMASPSLSVLLLLLSKSLPNPLLDDEPVYSAPAKRHAAGILYIILSNRALGMSCGSVETVVFSDCLVVFITDAKGSVH